MKIQQQIKRIRNPPKTEPQSPELRNWYSLPTEERKAKIQAIMAEIDFERLEQLHQGKFGGKPSIILPLHQQRELTEKMYIAIMNESRPDRRKKLVERAKMRCQREIFNLDERHYEFLQWLEKQ